MTNNYELPTRQQNWTGGAQLQRILDCVTVFKQTQRYDGKDTLLFPHKFDYLENLSLTLMELSINLKCCYNTCKPKYVNTSKPCLTKVSFSNYHHRYFINEELVLRLNYLCTSNHL